ncbi:cell division membrane protein [Streptococcus acidominimus]|uniref:Cell division membrane protein n=1 Tax=Streptococcus acidominimus TaxID=1326 RepID=A0A239XC67_STRAI|nr:YggT family protein [Streptococcus acidominimus]SNV44277.1 cell division membrane protein [Streptococcus acidominimus]
MVLMYLILVRLVRVYSTLLVIYALLSWFPGAYQTRLGQLLVSIVEPTLAPFRRLHLCFGGIDFTIIAVFFFLQLLLRVFSYLLLF